MTTHKDTAGIIERLERTEMFLDTMAETLEQWANQSISGGWSTHQVSVNRSQAELCRREAAIIRTALRHKGVG